MTNETGNLLTTGSLAGQSCIVVGGGPSLSAFDFSRLEGCITIGVNRAFEFFTPMISLALDARFYKWVVSGKYGERAQAKFNKYQGIKVGVRISEAHLPGVHEVKSLGVYGQIMPIETGIYHGNNSGYCAVSLALALGADPVYVMGIDMRSRAGKTHHHSGHPEITKEGELTRRCLEHFHSLSKTREGSRIKIFNPEWPRPSFSLLSAFFETVPQEV